jgi:tRNA(Ile)-lysidine synthase
LYDVLVHSLAQRLLIHIRRDELFTAGDRVGVAVSGGIDSVALLRLLLELRFELGIVLSVAHFNHKLRGEESDADEEFVRNLAREHDLEFYVDRADVAAHARDAGVGVETAARELRFGFFRSLIRNRAKEVKDPTLSLQETQGQGWGNPVQVSTARKTGEKWGTHGDFSPIQSPAVLNKIATGHTLDDQAETVLMRIIRGAGMRGLAAIYPRIDVEDQNGEHCGEIVRPLLETRRCELEGYFKEIDQCWREDSSNTEHHFTRNRVRRLLVPLLEKEFNPKIAQGLAELAEIAREEEDYWENEVAGWMGTAVRWSVSHVPHPPAENAGRVGQPQFVYIQPASSEKPDPSTDLQSKGDSSAMNASVDRLWFLGEPVAVQRRLIKAIAEEAGIPLEFKHVEEIVWFASENGPPGKKLALPLGWKLLRESAELMFLPPDSRQQGRPEDYEYLLSIPGRVFVRELNSEFEAQILDSNEAFRYELDALLDAQFVCDPVTIRNWRGGDRFRPAHTKSAKKLKDLLTDLHVTHAERGSWPVVVSGDEIVWVRGFPISAKYRAQAGERALLIREAGASEST